MSAEKRKREPQNDIYSSVRFTRPAARSGPCGWDSCQATDFREGRFRHLLDAIKILVLWRHCVQVCVSVLPFPAARCQGTRHKINEYLSMARTYGEIAVKSFDEVFKIASGNDTVFIDIGSGHGKIVVSAVQTFGCTFAIGIEKYRWILFLISE